jgi:DNA polymerase kappa
MTSDEPDEGKRSDPPATQHTSLKYSLLGPSLLKAGQDSVDQKKVAEIIFNASKGSKFFNREEEKDKVLTEKIARIRAKKARLEQLDLSRELRHADNLIAQLELSRDLSQHIVHVDCDAFYASVELLDRPELSELPFAVGGGVITTCNYIARKFGVRSGMSGFIAKKLCPDLISLKMNFDKYNAKAHEIRQIIAEYDPRFESASIDEAYLNITEYCAEHDVEPAEAIQQMRREVAEKTKITVSGGIAANAKIAKICSNMNKPNGQYELPNDRTAIMNFMRDLPCRKVNGIGRVFERELDAIGIKTCGDIYGQRQYLSQLFGEKAYEFLINCYLGLGRTRVQPAEEYERKSVGTESTFREKSDPAAFREQLRWTADELEKDMRRAGCKGRTLVLKIKLATFEVFTRQVVLPRSIHTADDLYNYSLPILAKLEQEMPNMRIRLMGLRCTHLVSTKKPDTRAFFGLRPMASESTGSGSGDERARQTPGEDAGSASEWEQWPEEELDGYEVGASPTKHDPAAEPDDGYRRHGKEIHPNPAPQKNALVEEELWDCPICNRPQPADERQFNAHIDLCLSRQTIRRAAQEVSDGEEQQQQQQQQHARAREETLDAKRSGGGAEKKRRGRPAAERSDPKQKKLRFG